MKKVKLILFDFGGVIAPEGFQLGIVKLAQEFGKTFEEMYHIAGHLAAFESGYSSGKADEREYWNFIASYIGTEEDLMKYRYVFLDNFQPRREMIELISRASKKIQLGIFSDQTNWIYELDEKYGFFKYFKYLIISYDVGCTKHDEGFYRIPAQRTGISPEEILVIDDKERVVSECRKKSMRGYRFTSVKDCTEYIDDIIK